jgi:hypothetical protein
MFKLILMILAASITAVMGGFVPDWLFPFALASVFLQGWFIGDQVHIVRQWK